jgi:predicted nicotinamide N-methyase
VTAFLIRNHANGVEFLVGDLGRTYLPRDRLTPVAAYDDSGLSAVEDQDVKQTTIWTAISA